MSLVVPMLNHLHSQKAPPSLQPKFPLLKVEASAPSPTVFEDWSPFRYVKTGFKPPLSTFFSRLNDPSAFDLSMQSTFLPSSRAGCPSASTPKAF